jgi:dTDP-4-amino-4,6-dideoxygalactose transaminase
MHLNHMLELIPVTKPFLPPIEEYKACLGGIWHRNWLTNQGPLVQELEQKIKDYLGVSHFLYTGNGTISLQLAINALNLKGKVITTPFSYIATTSSILWEGCEPVFVDIDPQTLNISSEEIARRLDKDIVAIVATHVYGNPCDMDAIQKLADDVGIPVIYDGAHAFGSVYRGKSVLDYGTISTCSFHATKIFHTIEGGGVFTKDESLHQRMRYMRNFGHKDFVDFAEIGINAKNCEFHAAMGLINLGYFEQIKEKRKHICETYDQLIKELPLAKPRVQGGGEINYSYYPVLFETEERLLKSVFMMEQQGISPRRYFFPAIHKIKLIKNKGNKLVYAEDISKRILCLPLYFELSNSELQLIAQTLKNSLK